MRSLDSAPGDFLRFRLAKAAGSRACIPARRVAARGGARVRVRAVRKIVVIFRPQDTFNAAAEINGVLFPRIGKPY